MKKYGPFTFECLADEDPPLRAVVTDDGGLRHSSESDPIKSH